MVCNSCKTSYNVLSRRGTGSNCAYWGGGAVWGSGRFDRWYSEVAGGEVIQKNESPDFRFPEADISVYLSYRELMESKAIYSHILGSYQRWHSGESTRLPPMWPRFKSRHRRHVWVEFVVGSLLCSERFFSWYSGFALSSKTNISKFQFDQESGRWRTTYWMCYL